MNSSTDGTVNGTSNFTVHGFHPNWWDLQASADEKGFYFAICSENHIQSDDSSASEHMVDFIIFQFHRKTYRSARFKQKIIFIPANTKQCTVHDVW